MREWQTFAEVFVRAGIVESKNTMGNINTGADPS